MHIIRRTASFIYEENTHIEGILTLLLPNMFRTLLRLRGALAGPVENPLTAPLYLSSEIKFFDTCVRAASTKTPPAVEKHMEFPGGRVPFCSNLQFVGGPNAEHNPLACYRTIDSTGVGVSGALIPHPLDETTAVQIYKTMVALQTVDIIFYEAQRQVGQGSDNNMESLSKRLRLLCIQILRTPNDL